MEPTWTAHRPGARIEIELRGGSVYLEDGPDDWPRRGPEGSGGTFTIEEVVDRGAELLGGYDGLYERVVADLAPRHRAVTASRAVLTTITDGVRPHAVPCCFAIVGDRLYTPIDDVKPKQTMALKRVRNIEAHPEVSVLIDEYDDDWSRLWWVRLDGVAGLLDASDAEAERAIVALRAKYAQYADAELRIIAVDIARWVCWPRAALTGAAS